HGALRHLHRLPVLVSTAAAAAHGAHVAAAAAHGAHVADVARRLQLAPERLQVFRVAARRLHAVVSGVAVIALLVVELAAGAAHFVRIDRRVLVLPAALVPGDPGALVVAAIGGNLGDVDPRIVAEIPALAQLLRTPRLLHAEILAVLDRSAVGQHEQVAAACAGRGHAG